MSLEVTDYTLADYDAVWALHQKTVKENAGFVKNLSFHTDIHDILSAYKTFFVMRDKGVIIGMVGVKQIDSKTLEIKRLQIAASYQGQGLAKKLMQHVFNYAQNVGASYLRLDVSESQVKAQNLYLSLGFHVTHTKERFLGPDHERFLSTYMEKKL